MNKKRVFVLALPWLLVAHQAWAQDVNQNGAPPATPEAVVEAATPASADTGGSSQSFDDWLAEFKRKFQAIGVASGGRTFFSGRAMVQGGSQDANFGKQLAMAYERAMFDMRADFVLQTYGRLKSESIHQIYENKSSNKDDFDPVELKSAAEAGGSRLEALLDKAMTLIDKKLDSELIDQGVPADQVQRMSVEQKKTIYKNNLNKNIVKKAFQSMQGLVPVQTRIFTDGTENGKGVVVGVIAVQSEKTRQFAQDISRKRPSLVKGAPRELSELLPVNEQGYLDEIGLRFAYDEAGRPMLLSYGRTSVAISPDWSPSRAFQSKENAKQVARTLAESNIVEFMNVNVQVEEITSLGSQEEERLTRITSFDGGNKADAQDTRAQVSEAISIFTRSGKARAQGDLRGTSVVKRWEQKDDNGVLHVGSVVSWTYGQLDNANAIDAQSRGRSAGGGQAATGAVTDQSRSSRSVNKLSDF